MSSSKRYDFMFRLCDDSLNKNESIYETILYTDGYTNM